MSIHPEQCCDKRKSGSILLELNILFIVMAIVSGVYCHMALQVFKNCRRVLADIEIAQAARYTESILRRELSYNSTQVQLAKDFNNRDQIICRKTFKNVRTYWYLSNTMLYRKTLKDTTTGVNPFSGPDIRMIRFKTVPLGKEKIGIIMNLHNPETGVERRVALSLFLSNGSVVK
ncbi:MAG: hypothetical protein IKZ43_00650 [Acidaminococcaceae bacterium]|nr:hypothetical protein [Acidaminococcaceae bacterium]